MKKHMLLLISSLFFSALNSQNLIQQIENAYNGLDSVSYIENIIQSYGENLLKENEEAENLRLELRGAFNNMDSLQMQNAGDSLMEKYDTLPLSYREDLTNKKVRQEIQLTLRRLIASAYLNLDGSMQRQNTYDSIVRANAKIDIEANYSMFISAVKNSPVHYVLNLTANEVPILQVDTGKLSFNLFYFDEYSNPIYYVLVKDGQYSAHDAHYAAFSPIIGKNAPKAFKKIMRKQPKYLLYCHELEGMNTLLYVLNDKIYVYRIAQNKEYELNDYMEKFIYPPFINTELKGR